ncbi:uncharacterized protein BO88DRAFT_171048 [Aspergillus vadensis CBS 113365]|uniref:Uncharacterized protein n=1 Tax=Aspergillus vadensis (strain CBS 113365 / IMI 142717 / IBT 24658) TaxID=1448311 RepID=A0A319BKJ3_ASPVC|nr:hypothetical protein BO88DRAFT_171048 [Aspergillus vadensis CBS 113365]PYH72851.1 hypothetical protein BO88DRAFT_171048 [Aspergillus vadensis CBS 113365]
MLLLTTHYYYFALCYAILLYCRYRLEREIFSKMMYSCLSRCLVNHQVAGIMSGRVYEMMKMLVAERDEEDVVSSA